MNRTRAIKHIERWIKKWNAINDGYMAEFLYGISNTEFRLHYRGVFDVAYFSTDLIFETIKTETNIRRFLCQELDEMKNSAKTSM